MPRTGRATIGNLPAEVTSFVDRRREVGQAKRLLAESRLVTLTGVGGAGKTRLAVRIAAALRRAFRDGTWFVDLTQLQGVGLPTHEAQDPDALTFLVMATLGLRQQGGGPPLRTLVEQLADRQMLLILDNCEHLLPASAMVADALLRGCPRLWVLATSRESLAIFGEVLVAVPPLTVPDLRRRPGLAELSRCDAVTLFLTRAAGAAPGFRMNEANHLAVAGLCQRLDGLPLAIELAAARIRVLSPPQMLDRLNHRFALLSRGNRSAPQRHQTLQACMDWSLDLCAKPERILWRRLSVFTGTFELDAVEGVCADEHLPEADLLDLVTGLVDKSILDRDDVADAKGGRARYRMLETIRDYGQDKLRAAGEDTALRRQHRDWYQRLVARVRAEWIGEREPYWLDRLRREHSNLRAAVEFCLAEPGEAEAALRIAVSLPSRYWYAQGLFGEGRRWLDRALAQATAPTALRARALVLNSYLAFSQGDAARATRLLEEGEELARRLDGFAALAHAHWIRGVGAMHANDLPVAVEALHRASTILSQAPDLDLELYLNVLSTLCVAAGLAGDHDRANACQQKILAIVKPQGWGHYQSFALWAGGLIAWLRGDFRQAAAQLLESLRLKQARESDDRYGVALCAETLAWTAANQQPRRAATLLGVADVLLTDIGIPMTSSLHLLGHHTTCEQRICDALGDRTFLEAFHQGRALSYQDALAYALDEQRRPAPPTPSDVPTPLTRREGQVANLIAQGLSNKDIAATLVISPRTAESHAEHILAKLGLTSRAQVAAWITEHTKAAR